MKTTIKNMSLIAAGIAIASITSIYAATIEANINSFTQYIQELFVTSDGTPTGNQVLSIDNNGQFRQTNNNNQLSIINKTLSFLGIDMPFAGIVHTTGDIGMYLGIQNIELFGGGNRPILGYSSGADMATVSVDYDDRIHNSTAVEIARRDVTNFGGQIIQNIISVGKAGILMVGDKAAGTTHTKFLNSDFEELMKINNDGSFIQTNFAQNTQIINGPFDIGFGVSPTVGTLAISGDLIGLSATSMEPDHVGITVGAINTAAGHLGSLGIDSNNAGTTVGLSWQNINSGIFNSVGVHENGVTIKGKDSDANTINTVFQSWSNNELMVIKNNGYVILPQVQQQFNFVDDSAAAAGGIPVGGLYHNNGEVRIRIQ